MIDSKSIVRAVETCPGIEHNDLLKVIMESTGCDRSQANALLTSAMPSLDYRGGSWGGYYWVNGTYDDWYAEQQRLKELERKKKRQLLYEELREEFEKS